MSHPELIGLNDLLKEFISCTQIQYNGRLDIKSANGHKWSFYYRLGRIVWASGGTHPLRRWRRNMTQHCPQMDIEKMLLRPENTSVDYWDYRLLLVLHQRQKLTREQIKVIVENTIAELLFDMAQQANCVSVSCDRSHDVALETPISFTSADMFLKIVQELWKAWSEAGLANIFPDSAPVLHKPDQLQQQVSSSVYKNFVSLLNGKHTLRDLAIKMNQDVLPITRSLLPYIQKGIIELVDIPDFPLPVAEVKNSSTASKPVASNVPLIACVDDSPQICEIIEKIMTTNGLRFIKIQDPVQALPILIQHKPDLIFLDLVMPIVNGYELCAQLRRISTFAETPIVIVTGNDGLMDRVRAKVVHSTNFITKPIAADKVMDVVRKYVKVPSPATTISKLNTQPIVC
ncbi:MAG: response regulator [Scytonema sp. PMC 1069.18]|nr:response regulator [Scytonema sp. PMC 1069.18]MEC4886710.1 response regulator [Scytonema sp. PMC 1070.18]